GREQSRADRDRRPARAAARRQRTRQSILDQIEARLRYSSNRGEPLDCGMESGRFSDRQLARTDEPDGHAIRIPVQRRGEQGSAENEDRQQAVAAERPAEQAEHGTRRDEERPGLENVTNDE